jgi:hypothetical protein
VLAALAGLGFSSAFAVADLGRPVGVGALGGVAGSVLVGGLLRRRVALSALGTLALLVPAGLLATGGRPGDLVTGARDGARLVLTSAVPMAPVPAALFVPFAATAMAAFAGAEAARRARNPVSPVLPSLMALGAGLAFGLAGSRPDATLALAWVATAALLVAVRRPGPGPAGRASGDAGAGAGAGADVTDAGGGGPAGLGRGAGDEPDGPGRAGRPGAAGSVARRVLGVALVVAVTAVAAPRVGERLPGAGQRSRFTLRDLVEQPARPAATANPLVLVTAWQDGPDEPLFTAEASGPVDRWRLAVLDTYDGVEWSSGATYVPVGPRLPDPPDRPDDDGILTQAVDDLALDGPWLPVAERPVAVGADDLLFDVGGGALLARDGRAPRRYTVESVAARPEPGDLRLAAAAGDHEADGMRDLPGNVPDDLRAAADDVTAGATSDYMKATAIERFLARSTDATPFQLATEALPSGHSVGHLRCFLLSTERCGRRGSTEQFVAAFAVLARAAGLPTRIVVGFTGAGGAPDGGGADRPDEVTAHRATAWAEVRFAGAGWVPFDPVPDPDVTTVTVPADVAGGGGAPDSSTATTLATTDGHGDTGGPVAPAVDGGGDARPVAAYAAAGALVAAVMASPAAVRRLRRRRRRRAADPALRVAGAWAEAADGLASAGVPVTAGGAVSDTVLAGRARLPDVAGPLVPLGELVNRSRFGPAAVTDDDAAAAWRLSDEFTAARHRARTAGQRAREYVALRAPARGRS